MQYTCGDWQTTFSGNCLSRTRVNNLMPDGTYANPTLTISNGCITQVVAGAPPITVRPELCGTTTTTPSAVVALDTNPCNLLSYVGTNLLARVYTQTGIGAITVTGCGTAGNPLAVTFTGSGFNRNDSCGWDVQDGLVHAMPATIVSSVVAGSGIQVTYNAGTCAATVTAVRGAIPHINTLCEFFGSPTTTYVLEHWTTLVQHTINTNNVGYGSVTDNFPIGLYRVYANGVLISLTTFTTCSAPLP